jgi:hypothetical protein
MHTAPGKQQLTRPQLAVCAAAANTMIMALRHHVHIALTDPSTWPPALVHKCGWAALASLLWMYAELIHLGVTSWLERLVVPKHA